MIRACSRSRFRNPAAGGGSAFTPLSLFTAGEQGLWFDPSDLTSMFQDDAGTIPVTAAGQVVGLIRDKSGNAHHASQATEASKPILRNTGSLWWIEFDGVDDFLVTAAIDFSGTNKYSGFFGVRKTSAVPLSVLAELSVTSQTNNGAFGIFAPPSADPTLTFGSRARSTVTLDTASNLTFPNPTTAVLTTQADLSVFSSTLRVNTDQTMTAAAPSGINFGNYPLYIGRRAGATSPFTGLLYGMIIRGVASNTLTVANTEGYMAAKSGVTLP